MPLDKSPETFIIDCSAPPTIPESLALKAHAISPALTWREGLVSALSPKSLAHSQSRMLPGSAVLQHIERVRRVPWNANMLDALRTHPSALDESVLPRGGMLIFLGTTYLQSGYKTPRQTNVRKPRQVYRALKRGHDGLLDEAIKEYGGHWLRGRDFAAVQPEP